MTIPPGSPKGRDAREVFLSTVPIASCTRLFYILDKENRVPVRRFLMRPFARPLALTMMLLFCAAATAQDANVLFQGNIRLPRDITFGDETLARGSYQLALTEAEGETWFVLSKSGKEVSKDIAIEWPAKELPTTGMQSEILPGDTGAEYFRVRVRKGNSVYFIHYKIKA